MANIYNLPPELTKIILGEVIEPEVNISDNINETYTPSHININIKCISGIGFTVRCYLDWVDAYRFHELKDEVTNFLEKDEGTINFVFGSDMVKKSDKNYIVTSYDNKIDITRNIARTVCIKVLQYMTNHPTQIIPPRPDNMNTVNNTYGLVGATGPTGPAWP